MFYDDGDIAVIRMALHARPWGTLQMTWTQVKSHNSL